MNSLTKEKLRELKTQIEIDFLRRVVLPGIETEIIAAHELDRATAYIQGLRKIHTEMNDLILIMQRM